MTARPLYRCLWLKSVTVALRKHVFRRRRRWRGIATRWRYVTGRSRRGVQRCRTPGHRSSSDVSVERRGPRSTSSLWPPARKWIRSILQLPGLAWGMNWKDLCSKWPTACGVACYTHHAHPLLLRLWQKQASVRLSWLENAYSHPLYQRAILTSNVGQTDLVFGMRSGFISRSVHARLQVSVCSSYDLFHHG